METPCVYCEGSGRSTNGSTPCAPCQGSGQLYLDLQRRKVLATQLLEDRATVPTPHHRLALRVVTKSIEDLGNPDDSTLLVAGGALNPWLAAIGIQPTFFLKALRDAQLLQPFRRLVEPFHPLRPLPTRRAGAASPHQGTREPSRAANPTPTRTTPRHPEGARSSSSDPLPAVALEASGV